VISGALKENQVIPGHISSCIIAVVRKSKHIPVILEKIQDIIEMKDPVILQEVLRFLEGVAGLTE